MFGFGKKKEESTVVRSAVQNVKVLGAGCKSCHAMLESAQAAVKSLDLALEVEYITDMKAIMAMGVTGLPALVVNDRVVSMGKVLGTREICKILKG